MLSLLKNQKTIQLGQALLVFALVLLPLNVTYASLGEAISKAVFEICVRLGGLVLLLGATVLDGAIWKLVIGMGELYNGGLGAAVNLGWVMIRDILNMCFIFGLIYIGIKTILNSEDSGTRRQLGYLIIAALLINFSLFITQVVVDFSNILATQVYSQVVDGQGMGTDKAAAATSPIASKFLSVVGLSSFFSPSGIQPNHFTGNLFLFAILLFIFFVLAGIAFFLGSILIVTRFIALLLYMIFSPVMFLGWILPRFQSISTSWWNGFFKYSFFGPVYIFMLLISLRMLEGLVGRGAPEQQASTFAQALGGERFTVSAVEMLTYFVIMIGMLWASLKIGNQLSIAGGKMAVGAFSSIGRSARTGAQGFAYRNTVGRGFDLARKGYDSLDQSAEKGSRGARIGRALLGGEAGRRAVVKGRDYGAGGIGWSENEKMNDERSARATRGNRLTSISSNISANIGQADKAQLGELMGDTKARAQIIENAHLLKPDQIKSLLESDKVDDNTKQKLRDSRDANFKKLAKTDPDKLLSGKAGDIADLPDDVFKEDNFIKKLDVGTLKALERKQGKRGVAQEIRKKLEAEISSNSYTNQADLDRLAAVDDWFRHNPAGASFGK